MARLNKKGIDYFSHDVNMSDDIKIKYIEAQFGLTGYAIFNKLLEKIYKDGYYVIMDNKALILFSSDMKIDILLCTKVINECLSEELFNKNLFENYNVLTSIRIQQNYIEACNRRKSISLIEEYLLINPSEFLDQKSKLKINVNKSGINVNTNPKNVNSNPINDNINSQKEKEKESILNKRNIKEKKEELKLELVEPEHPLQIYVRDNFPLVAKLGNQLTKEECEKLISTFDKKEIKSVLENMDNTKNLEKKYNSVYRTLKNWLSRNQTQKISSSNFKKQAMTFDTNLPVFEVTKEDIDPAKLAAVKEINAKMFKNGTL